MYFQLYLCLEVRNENSFKIVYFCSFKSKTIQYGHYAILYITTYFGLKSRNMVCRKI